MLERYLKFLTRTVNLKKYMADFIIPFVILTLIAVIVIQAVERYSYASQMEKVKDKLVAAVLSKNMNEYNDNLRIEKQPKTPVFPEATEQEASTMDDKEFDNHIKAMNEEE